MEIQVIGCGHPITNRRSKAYLQRNASCHGVVYFSIWRSPGLFFAMFVCLHGSQTVSLKVLISELEADLDFLTNMIYFNWEILILNAWSADGFSSEDISLCYESYWNYWNTLLWCLLPHIHSRLHTPVLWWNRFPSQPTKSTVDTIWYDFHQQ